MNFRFSPSVVSKSTRERKCTSKSTAVDKFLPKRFSRILGPPSTWKIFSRQNEAISYAKNYGEGVMAFAFQRDDGTRGFLAAHPELVWHIDSQKDPADRRTFEIILEDAPCKMYLDLEFDRTCNPDHDGIMMTNIFIYILCSILKREFNIECDRNSVLDLDSTTDFKFSRHLIFQITKTCFRNNYHVGSFVRKVCQEIRLGYASGDGLCGKSSVELKQLFVKDKKNKTDIFCDEGVYTKNRHFRLFKSTKWNKNSPLVVSQENTFISPNKKSEYSKDECVFLDSLVTLTIHCQDSILVVPDATSCSEYGVKESGKTSLSSKPIQSDMSLGSSPIPAVDKFIEDLVYPGHVRRWMYFVENNTLDYDIVGNRYCHNIGRAHKSNNVKYIVDLKKGVYYQKCYDSDCTNYRSPETGLPAQVLLSVDYEDDSQLGQVAELPDEDLTEVYECVNAMIEDESYSEKGIVNQSELEKCVSALVEDELYSEKGILDQSEVEECVSALVEDEHYSEEGIVDQLEVEECVSALIEDESYNENGILDQSEVEECVSALVEDEHYSEEGIVGQSEVEESVNALVEDEIHNEQEDVEIQDEDLIEVVECADALFAYEIHSKHQEVDNNLTEVKEYVDAMLEDEVHDSSDNFPDYGMLDDELMNSSSM